MTPFVGRARELRQLRTWLADGRHVVVTGTYGSGRTALLRQLATDPGADLNVQFITADCSKRGVALALEPHFHRRRRLVAVLDDVISISRGRLTFMATAARRYDFSWVVIADRALPAADLLRLRIHLAPAPVIKMSALSPTLAHRLLRQLLCARGLTWTADDIRLTALSTHGVPLLLCLAADAARRRTRRRDGAIWPPFAETR